MTSLVEWLIGGAWQVVAPIIVAVITAFGLYAKGRSDGKAKADAKAAKDTINTVKEYQDAKSSRADGNGWHDRLRQSDD